jgi:PncC family amidohydrolase
MAVNFSDLLSLRMQANMVSCQIPVSGAMHIGFRVKGVQGDAFSLISIRRGINTRMSISLERTIGSLLRLRRMKLATAESCTGGLVADRITDIPGSSDYFVGGVITYANEAKVTLLQVSWDTLRLHGAVSQETVIEMARGVRSALGADIGISVSGIAGPGGGSTDNPIGTTWIGLSAPDGEWTRKIVWGGDRRTNKESSAQAALQFAKDYLDSKLKNA